MQASHGERLHQRPDCPAVNSTARPLGLDASALSNWEKGQLMALLAVGLGTFITQDRHGPPSGQQ